MTSLQLKPLRLNPGIAPALLALLLVPLASALFTTKTDAAEPKSHRNVLFIAIDDLNDWVGALGGHPQSATPNMDKLAERGMLFTNAHCNAHGCNASRTSLLMGLRPSTTRI